MTNETAAEVEIQYRYAPFGSKEMQGQAHLPVADSDITKHQGISLGACFMLKCISAYHFADFGNICVSREFEFNLAETAEPEFKLAVHIKNSCSLG